MRLCQLDVAIWQFLYIDTKIILEIALVIDIEECFHVIDCFVHFFIVRQSEDSIVGVHDEDYSSVEENTFVDF